VHNDVEESGSNAEDALKRLGEEKTLLDVLDYSEVKLRDRVTTYL
jgi:hypothetical protein